MVELEGDDGGVETGVERMQHRLGHRHAEMRLQHWRRVGQHHGDRVALADAVLLQRRGELQRAAPEIAVADALAAVDDGYVVGIRPCRALQIGERRQRLVVGRVPVEILFVRIAHPVLPKSPFRAF